MYIGEAAKLSGVTVKTIRHYEALGLLPGVVRRGSYRVFSEQEIVRIRLIRQARGLGFSLKEVRVFMGEVAGSAQWSAIRRLFMSKSEQLAGQIAELQEKQRRLDEYADAIDRCLTQDPGCPGPLV